MGQLSLKIHKGHKYSFLTWVSSSLHSSATTYPPTWRCPEWRDYNEGVSRFQSTEYFEKFRFFFRFNGFSQRISSESSKLRINWWSQTTHSWFCRRSLAASTTAETADLKRSKIRMRSQNLHQPIVKVDILTCHFSHSLVSLFEFFLYIRGRNGLEWG